MLFGRPWFKGDWQRERVFLNHWDLFWFSFFNSMSLWLMSYGLLFYGFWEGVRARIRAMRRGEGDLVFGVDTPQSTRKGDRTCEPPVRGSTSHSSSNHYPIRISLRQAAYN